MHSGIKRKLFNRFIMWISVTIQATSLFMSFVWSLVGIETKHAWKGKMNVIWTEMHSANLCPSSPPTQKESIKIFK